MAMRRVRPVRIDGTEFENRQIVGEQNRISSTYKTYLKILFGLHLTVLIMMWAKVFCENAVTYFGMESVFWRKLDLPPAYLWEYVWCLSIIPNILALYAMPNNRVSLHK
uniref:Uncharacterized protein n=1 Tax=Panagrolaimus superbus TaxID=310955 RepID=A0A914YGF3_9BILA